MSDALTIGKKLVELCRQHKNIEAMETLYAPNIVSIEPYGSPEMPARQEGIDAIRAKTKWWYDNHEVHSGTAEGPWPHGDRFIVRFKYEVTAKTGPMKGQRMQIDEAALYTFAGGKIVQEEFFYSMEG
jgi:ketosteroid isomerase-like protein